MWVRCTILGWLVMICLSPLPVCADWPQWRGPQRDGTIRDFQPPEVWPEGLRRVWSVSVGKGHSSPVVVGDRVVVMTREDDHEIVRCLLVADGREAWRREIAAPAELDAAVGRFGKSPRSTPAIADGRVFCLGAAGTLTALELKSGRQLWQHAFQRQLPKPYPEFGAAASPLVLDESVMVPIGGKDKGALAAFEVATGKMRWTLPDEGPSYASPVLLPMPTGKQLVTQTQSHLVGVSTSGKRLWRLPFETEYRQNIVTAVAFEGLVIFGGTNKPLAALKLDANSQPTLAWENSEHACYMSSPVLNGNLLYGMSQRSAGCIFCVDARTGKTLWKGPGRAGENVSVQRAGNVLVLLSDRGELIFLASNPREYQVLAQYQVADSPVFAHPVLDGQRILVKDEQDLICWVWR